ncbi:hypothetical protein N7499_005826 [Penicillium canescens]|nr:hypothetical protein N7444_003974 [Penicillium canescens]KAJ6080952.1 hypothetical protein N7499_005826 [Penicillium canescens]
MSIPNTLFRGATIGSTFTTAEQVQQALALVALNLFEEVRAAKQGFTIDTKISPGNDSAGAHTATAIRESLEKSLGRLAIDKVNILYFHRPDLSTPILEQAAEINRQYLEGRFQKFGLSNFPPELVVEFITICEEHNYIKPSVYQGLYNLLSRGSEQLVPLLRQHGIAFQEYSPLAGGFLTGRMTRGDVVGNGCAPGNTAFQGYSSMYDKPEMHAAITDLQDTIEPLQISGSQACLRWIYYHSMLGEGDRVILGASKISQIVQNVDDVSKGPLPVEVVQKIDLLWEKLC